MHRVTTDGGKDEIDSKIEVVDDEDKHSSISSCGLDPLDSEFNDS